MNFKKMLWLIVGSMVCGASAVWAAGSAVPEGAKGVLEVEYVITSSGKQDHQGSGSEWKVDRKINMRYELVAGKLQSFGRSNPEAAEKIGKQGQEVAKQGEAAAKKITAKHAPTMAEIQRAMEACGDDDDCLDRLGEKMMKDAQDPSSAQSSLAKDAQKELAPVGKEVKKLEGQMPAPAIQPWFISKGKSSTSGTFNLNERKRNYDTLTCTKGREVCETTRKRVGEGPISLSGTSSSEEGGFDPVELDTAKNLISVMIPAPLGVLKVEETTVTDLNGPGKPKQIEINQCGLSVEFGKIEGLFKPVASPSGGSLRELKGEKEIVLKAGIADYAGPAKITVRWRFSALQ